jgi:hypothetical protein
MTDHSQDQIGVDEPEGGWVVAPTLVDTQILTIALCRFTGCKPNDETEASDHVVCPERVKGVHVDEECITLYHQADALRAGLVQYDLAATEVTVSEAGNEPTYQHPLDA